MPFLFRENILVQKHLFQSNASLCVEQSTHVRLITDSPQLLILQDKNSVYLSSVA